LRAVQAAVGYPADARRSEIAAHGLLRAGDVPVQVSGYAGVAATERYEWTLWGTRRSYQLRDWRQLFVSDGGEWTPVDVAGHGTGAGSTRLSLFAEAIGGRRPPNLADFADALRVQEAVEAFYT
jgi:predicted dehydrogenase